MKKTQTVNIGGMAFILDEDAYIALGLYLKAIEKNYPDDDERKEIMEDIETRIGEILRGHQKKSRQVITIEDVENLIRVMGTPEDFKGEEDKQQKSQYHKMYKKVYRDPDNRILGGVCSGLAAYFEIDLVLMRVIFIITFLLFGIGVLIYLILWIIIPEARTFEQKQEMRGKSIRYNHMKDFVKQEYEQVKNNFCKEFKTRTI